MNSIVKIAHASIDENKNIKNGLAGDQTGKEVCIRDWYNKPWNVVIRFNDSKMRDKCAAAMEKAANNNHIGYDQNQRNTLLNAARAYGYDPQKVKTDVETDCSALVTLACIYAGISENDLVKSGNSATTSTLKQRLKATGKVKLFEDRIYTRDTEKLLRGDILLSEGHHVAVVVTGKTADKSIDDVVEAVLRGEYGNGAERRRRLAEDGWDYQQVQTAINQRLKR